MTSIYAQHAQRNQAVTLTYPSNELQLTVAAIDESITQRLKQLVVAIVCSLPNTHSRTQLPRTPHDIQNAIAQPENWGLIIGEVVIPTYREFPRDWPAQQKALPGGIEQVVKEAQLQLTKLGLPGIGLAYIDGPPIWELKDVLKKDGIIGVYAKKDRHHNYIPHQKGVDEFAEGLLILAHKAAGAKRAEIDRLERMV